ncbi:MAG: hypothetical protein DRN81_03205 [Thermoproteota archaeon]|nr:MAG: hypothetical protein DRN81_03205 [Candidatus Korarchaeota archaeon]
MSQVFTGAKAIVKINGLPLAFVGAISITHENRLEETPQLDSLEVAEYGEIGHRCSFVVNMFKIEGNTANDYGWDPVDYKTILTQPESLWYILDETTGDIVYEMSGVKFGGGSGSLDPRGVWLGTWNFKARRGKGI